MSLRNEAIQTMALATSDKVLWFGFTEATRVLDALLDYLEQHADDPIVPITDDEAIWQARVSEVPLGLLIAALRGSYQ